MKTLGLLLELCREYPELQGDWMDELTALPWSLLRDIQEGVLTLGTPGQVVKRRASCPARI
jgi:hypothetical protein